MGQIPRTYQILHFAHLDKTKALFLFPSARTIEHQMRCDCDCDAMSCDAKRVLASMEQSTATHSTQHPRPIPSHFHLLYTRNPPAVSPPDPLSYLRSDSVSHPCILVASRGYLRFRFDFDGCDGCGAELAGGGP